MPTLAAIMETSTMSLPTAAHRNPSTTPAIGFKP